MTNPGVIPIPQADNVWENLNNIGELRPFITNIDINKPTTFSSPASRIFGDLSNSTISNRLLFQTSESIATTGVAASGVALYTCPASTNAILSTLFVCNRNTTTGNFTVAHVDNGTVAQLSFEDYLYDLQIGPKDTFASTSGISMSEGDSIVIWSDTLFINFVAEGIEIT
jgi:hypothetical protein